MSTPDLETQIARLREQAQQAERTFHRSVASQEHAQQEAGKLRAQLKAEFGVETVDEASKLLEKLRADLAAEVAKVQEHLSLASAT